MKKSLVSVMVVLALGLFSVSVFGKDEAAKEEKTVAGKSACATCDGVTKDGHKIMIVDKDGTRWVLIGEGENYKKAHKVRDKGVKMTATYTEEPVTKKDEDGKEYKEVKIKDVKVEEA